MTIQEFLDKWNKKFADNEFQNITEGTFRAFKEDVANLQALRHPFRVATEIIQGHYYYANGSEYLRTGPTTNETALGGDGWELVVNGATSTNLQRGGPFYVRNFSALQKASADDSCLEELPVELLCLGCLVHVELGAEAGWWWPVYDNSAAARAAPQISQDGRFRGVLVPYKWVKEGSQEAADGAVEFFDAQKKGGYFGPNNASHAVSVVRYTLGGVTQFYTAARDMLPPVTAPTSATDANWTQVNAPKPTGATVDLSNYNTKAQDEALYGVARRTTTVITFDQDVEYASINTTFTVDASTAKVGKVVRVTLGYNATEPTIPSTGFQRLNGNVFTAGKKHIYSFCVSAEGVIDYYITLLI